MRIDKYVLSLRGSRSALLRQLLYSQTQPSSLDKHNIHSIHIEEYRCSTKPRFKGQAKYKIGLNAWQLAKKKYQPLKLCRSAYDDQLAQATIISLVMWK